MEELDQGIDNLPHLGTEKVPNSAGVLVLGILSIVPGCICYGVPGIVMGIIALSLASGANKLIKQNPGKYSENSIQLVKAGKICGIIGLSLSSLFILYLIAVLSFVGTVAMSGPAFNF
ncbi:MAG TPA: CCC motif membrane protein [Brumimicrobium sp.]|nr:CCC motif membrane protein [Brumimicrobium sp.]